MRLSASWLSHARRRRGQVDWQTRSHLGLSRISCRVRSCRWRDLGEGPRRSNNRSNEPPCRIAGCERIQRDRRVVRSRWEACRLPARLPGLSARPLRSALPAAVVSRQRYGCSGCSPAAFAGDTIRVCDLRFGSAALRSAWRLSGGTRPTAVCREGQISSRPLKRRQATVTRIPHVGICSSVVTHILRTR